MTSEHWYQKIKARLFSRSKAEPLSGVTVRIDDAPGWAGLTNRPHDYDSARMLELYADALECWRKNPIAWRIISITTDFVVGDQLKISSPHPEMSQFIEEFWNHPQNRLNLRLASLSDELARAGDLFVLLFRNPLDGMSYIRLLTKDRIERIETAEKDWETELAYYEKLESGGTRRWLSPHHPEAAETEAILLHYAVNRPAGALLGESDLTTMIPWLQRYSRMLEDRVRLHWAVRTFLWVISVPTSAVEAKREQYRNPPEAGSVIVKDSGETWEAVAPDLRAQDARWDMQAVRQMIDAGSGYPPHWRGEAGDANLATASAMQGPTERHLLRRQQYFVFMLEDILFHAYQRACELGQRPPLQRPALRSEDYAEWFTAVLPEISRWDNESLARAAKELGTALQAARSILGGDSHQFKRLAMELICRFAGVPQTDQNLDAILAEAGAATSLPPEEPGER